MTPAQVFALLSCVQLLSDLILALFSIGRLGAAAGGVFIGAGMTNLIYAAGALS